jgi:excinuclease UvrABC nuclease subunit
MTSTDEGLLYRDRELELMEHPAVLFRYVASIQEEVHRFAVDYHRVYGRRPFRDPPLTR